MSYRGAYQDELVIPSLSLSGTTPPTAGFAKIVQSITPTVVATLATAEQSFAVPGLLTGDFVFVSPPSFVSGIALGGARVPSAGTLAVQFSNFTTGTLTPAAGSHIIMVER